MIPKCLTYLNAMVFLLLACNCFAINYEGTEIGVETKPSYILKCFWNRHDCTILEISTENSEENLIANEKENTRLDKRNQFEEDVPESNVHFQKLIKRIFPRADGDSPLSSRLFKTEQVNCLTGDCSLLTARISKRRNNLGTLACIGDPYSSSGSRCLPLEGLYIG